MRKFLLAIGILYAACATAASSASGLTGLWGVKHSFAPPVAGTLVIDGRSSHWRAAIDGFSPAVQHAGCSVHFQLPGGQGSFRGTVAKNTGMIVGQWIQPPIPLYGIAYATPVVLRRIEPHVWQGTVAPHRENLTLYLDITANKDGSLFAFFRNPQVNFGRDDPYSVAIDGNAVALKSTRNAEDVIEGHYHPDTSVLELRMPQFGMTLRLTRRDRASARDFYASTPAASSYAYRVPIHEDDGWKTASLTAVGLNQRSIQTLVDRILATRYTGFHTPYIHSLLIARHDKLVFEKYFYGFDRERAHDMRSASKTFAGVLVGLAMAHGAKFTLDTSVLSLFPQYRKISNVDARKRAMTVRDLLTMTSGLACDDNDDSSPGNEDRMQSQHAQRDWYLYTLDLPMARAPGGTHAVYCSAGINLLGGIVRNATGMAIPEFFYRYVARPLQMRGYHINLMPICIAYMGGGIRMRARDQLKLGQLYLDNGVWNGRRVVPAAWVRQSLKVYSRFGPDHGYGFAWHEVDLQSGGQTYRTFEAGGNGGQFVLIVPKLDMVVGFTAGNYGDFKTWYRFMTDLVPRYLIPAATRSRS